MQIETNNFVKNITDEVTGHAKEISQLTEKQIQSIQKSLEEELTKSLESFAGVMITLSNKFAQDYTPLTESLRRIIQISKGVENVSQSTN